MVEKKVAELLVKIAETTSGFVASNASAWFHFQEKEPAELITYN